MKRSCFAFHLNSCLNILSFFFIFIFNSNSYKSFVFVSFVSVRSRIVGGTNLYLSYLACLLLECFFFSQAPQLVILRLDYLHGYVPVHISIV